MTSSVAWVQLCSKVPSFTEYYRVLSSFTEFYRVLPSFIKSVGSHSETLIQMTSSVAWVQLCSMLTSFTELNRVLPSFTEFYQVLPSSRDSYSNDFQCGMGHIEYYRVLSSFTEHISIKRPWPRPRKLGRNKKKLSKQTTQETKHLEHFFFYEQRLQMTAR